MLKKLTELFRKDSELSDDNRTVDAPMAAAALMLEVTWADHETDDAEIERSVALLETLFNLNTPSASQLVEDARERLQEHVGVQS
jgi:uncharacterized tellurite resistance protein B-like protein